MEKKNLLGGVLWEGQPFENIAKASFYVHY